MFGRDWTGTSGPGLEGMGRALLRLRGPWGYYGGCLLSCRLLGGLGQSAALSATVAVGLWLAPQVESEPLRERPLQSPQKMKPEAGTCHAEAAAIPSP